MKTYASIAKEALSSGKMTLDFAWDLLYAQSPESWFDHCEEDGVEYPGLDDDEIEKTMKMAEETFLSQNDHIFFIFEKCNIGEDGYENRIMGLATELVSDDPEVIDAIKRAYRSIEDEAQQFYLQYVIERAGKTGMKILSELEVDMEKFYEMDAEWSAIYNGGI